MISISRVKTGGSLLNNIKESHSMILKKIKERFGSEIVRTAEEHRNLVAVIKKDHSHEILQFLRDDPELSFDLLADLAGVDRSVMKKIPRFEVVYQLYSIPHNHRLRLHVEVPEEDCKVSTATDLWHCADWFERECWEMFGIVFEGHPNLKHLLMFDGFEGHPLRKD